MADEIVKPPNPPETQTNAMFKDSIDVPYEGHTYTFRIPNLKDKNQIKSKAGALRRESDPDYGGQAWNYSFTDMQWFEDLATFMLLLKASDASWVYSPDSTPGPGRKPVINLENIPDNAPIEEVVDKFREELVKFREGRN